MTDGTSAQFTNQSVPDATVRAGVHAPPVRSENLRVAVVPLRSIQLRRTPRADTDSRGCALPGGAGDAIGSMTAHSGCAARDDVGGGDAVSATTDTARTAATVRSISA